MFFNKMHQLSTPSARRHNLFTHCKFSRIAFALRNGFCLSAKRSYRYVSKSIACGMDYVDCGIRLSSMAIIQVNDLNHFEFVRFFLTDPLCF